MYLKSEVYRPQFYLFLLFLVMAISFSTIIDYFSKKQIRETVSLWYVSEVTSLEQGNFLTSITKLERVISNNESSLTGVKLVEYYGSGMKVLINLGSEFKVDPVSDVDSLIQTKFFTADYIAHLKLKPDLIVYFNFKPRLNQFLLLSITIYFFILFFVFNRLNFRLFRTKKIFKTKMKAQRIRAKQRVNNRISELALKLAHDIRSPLSTLNIISSKIADHQLHQLQISVISQINQIANDLLIESKTAAGVFSNSMKREVVNQCTYLQLFKNLSEEYSIKSTQIKSPVYFELDSNLKNISVFAPTFLYSSMNNLIQNSIEATCRKVSPAIFVKASLINDTWLEVKVTDNGEGIPASVLSNLGQIKISHGKLKSHESGSGIGIYNTYNAVKAVGGSISFHSVLNEKTTLTLLLPILAF